MLEKCCNHSKQCHNNVAILRRALEKKTAKNISFLGRTKVVTKHSEKSFVTCFLFLTGLSFHLRHLVNSEEADSVEKEKDKLVNKIKICMHGSSVLQLSYPQKRDRQVLH